MIQAKILMEDKMGVPKTFFTTYGRQNKQPTEIAMYESKLKELEQQGFDLSHSGIHLKHLKKNENKNLVIFNIYPSIYIKHKWAI